MCSEDINNINKPNHIKSLKEILIYPKAKTLKLKNFEGVQRPLKIKKDKFTSV